jgi:hypothetical protein
VSGASAVLIAVFSGLVGVLLRNAHERSADLRTRQLQAADDFLAAMIPALDDIDRSSPSLFMRFDEVQLTMHGAKAEDVALADLDASVKTLTPLLARIDLLFGVKSASAISAHAAVNELSSGTNLMHYYCTLPLRVPDEQFRAHLKGVYERFLESQRKAHLAYERFGPAARRVVVPWWKWWQRSTLPPLESPAPAPPQPGDGA